MEIKCLKLLKWHAKLRTYMKKSTIKLKQMIIDRVRSNESLKEYALWRAKRKPTK